MNKILIYIYFFSLSLVAKSQTADFSYQSTDSVFCSPTIVRFTQAATGSPKGFVWTFGNGDGSNSPNPETTYQNAGSYTVKLIVIYARSTVVVTKTVVVNQSITVSIGYDRNYICKPGVINFTATTTGNVAQYDWDFGDGLPVETTPANKVTHNYTAAGVYTLTLKATASSGCAGANQTTITVQSPPIKGTVSPVSGCVPANVRFVANVQIPVNSTITNYSWNFGDGSPVASTITGNTNHIYSAPGKYLPKLNITTSEGCTNSYDFARIAYGTPPFNHIAYPVKIVICGSDSAAFVSKAVNANSYRWNFGDGKITTVTDTLTHHKYDSLGIKNVTVIPAYNGCNGNPITFRITVEGVIATYKYSNTCTDKKTFSFINTSQGNLSFVSWDFGDGSAPENTVNASHTFPSSGSFITKLTVTDVITGCTDTYSRTIYIANPALVNADSSICKNDSTTFIIVNNYSDPSATYTWDVAGTQVGPVKDSSLTLSAKLFGNFNNFVIINNGAQYCRDTIRLNNTLLVRGPSLSFTALPSICLNSIYNVTNTSTPFIPADSVNLWYWNFGVKTENDSVYQPQPYVYDNPGTYKVKLTGIDINGCKDSLVKTITINPLPFLYVIPAGIDTVCSGKADSLIAFHSDSITWSPSNSITCARCDTVLATPSSTTQYNIIASTRFGCTVTDSVLLKVFPPFVAVPLLTDPYVCPNDTVQLNVDPPGERIIWSPAAGLSNTNNYGPIASPAQSTTYTATLTDSVGCFTSTANITVHLKSPPLVDAGPDKVYPYNAGFSINPTYSSNISSYNWTPSDVLSCNNCPDPNGIATSSNTFFIEVTSDSGCVAKDDLTIYVECKDANILMPTAFTPNDDNLNDYFYPLTRGIKSITRFSIYNRFGKLVFEARNFPPNDKSFGWNGKINNVVQPNSVFVYYLDALCDLGARISRKGSVVLVR
ncbi:MAG: PKD domain-containing protein [Ginsengibacter sp.]